MALTGSDNLSDEQSLGFDSIAPSSLFNIREGFISSGIVTSSVDRDYYELQVTEGFQYTVTMESGGTTGYFPRLGNRNLEIDVQSSNGSILASSTASTDVFGDLFTDTLTFTAASTATYYVDVHGPVAGSASYSVAVSSQFVGSTNPTPQPTPGTGDTGNTLPSNTSVSDLYASLLQIGFSEAETYTNEMLDFQALVDAGTLTIDEVATSLFASDVAQNTVFPVFRMYQAAFNRLPDSSGLNFWSDGIRTGSQNIDSLAASFTETQEFITRFNLSGTVNNDYVNALYSNVLRRTPDQAGFDFWVNSGSSATDILESFVNSNEFVISTNELVQTALLGVAAGGSLSPIQSLFDLQ